MYTDIFFYLFLSNSEVRYAVVVRRLWLIGRLAGGYIRSCSSNNNNKQTKIDEEQPGNPPPAGSGLGAVLPPHGTKRNGAGRNEGEGQVGNSVEQTRLELPGDKLIADNTVREGGRRGRLRQHSLD